MEIDLCSTKNRYSWGLSKKEVKKLGQGKSPKLAFSPWN